ncbi:2-iminoacetate synthase ThiH [Acidaminobacter sp. JC074]|uniref:2-iminoacetate synthase ThiH n=1 Tax=Acidaminobacter sp. JC074 TaxID=2530199 RepID=UPI001F0DBE1A|nr:2-iminoacetate synthase ThiH [Acidaminobacter sp. JC074]MCH4890367.1 2-iminoacetate synthase ThiH [Acidaminobacter sp. JC074]
MLDKRVIDKEDLRALLSPVDDVFLEEMAERAYREHMKFFGKSILLYTPLYLANYCVNQCVYCGYNVKNDIKRHQLGLDQVEAEAKAIYETGLRHILILTGESERHTPVDYILSAVKVLKKFFSSIAIEIYPLSQTDYERMIQAGVDSLTIYQEVYDRKRYSQVHPYGPKSDYDFRFLAPERAAEAGMFHINIGALLGLHDLTEEVYQLACHVKDLQDRYPEVTFSVSVPRIRPFEGQTFESVEVSDRMLVQIILALKIYLPTIGITLSTRESKSFRNHMLPFVSKMSAGVKTTVGGHSDEAASDVQFDIADERSVDEMMKDLKVLGYQPVLKDWLNIS